MKKGLTILAAIVFAMGLLFYLALESAPDSPPSGVAHSAAGAENACRLALRDSVGDASFPFGANTTYLGDADYHLAGMLDVDLGAELGRRNYECWVRYLPNGAYRTDSIRVWQSH